MFDEGKMEIGIAGANAFFEDNLLDDFEIMMELGDAFASVKQFEQAQHCYDRAADLEPDKELPYVGFGMIALQNHQLEEAVNAFKVAKRLDPESSKAYCGLALAYQELEEYSDSFDCFLKCLEFDTNNLTALLGLFQTSCQMGSFSKVIYYLEVYLAMNPDDSSVMICLATLYMKDSQLVKSKRMLNKILDNDPENTDSLNLLEEVEYLLEKEKTA